MVDQEERAAVEAFALDDLDRLVAEVYDGSAAVQLVWLGRRKIRGIDPGAYLKATGLLCRPGGVPTIYNPAYELVPRHEH